MQEDNRVARSDVDEIISESCTFTLCLGWISPLCTPVWEPDGNTPMKINTGLFALRSRPPDMIYAAEVRSGKVVPTARRPIVPPPKWWRDSSGQFR